MMPVLDGFGLIRALKASQTEAALIPVIIITARAFMPSKCIKGIGTDEAAYLSLIHI